MHPESERERRAVAGCDCLTKMDEALKPHNGQIARRWCFDERGIDATALLTVEKVVPRGKKPPGIIAKFCPFCGTPYPPVETRALS